jgi:hypothetical protein
MLYFGEMGLQLKRWPDHKNTKIELAHKLILQTTLLQTQFTHQQVKHAIHLSKSNLAQKVFVGPNFCITKLSLNKVTKSWGVTDLPPLKRISSRDS